MDRNLGASVLVTELSKPIWKVGSAEEIDSAARAEQIDAELDSWLAEPMSAFQLSKIVTCTRR